MWVLFLCFLRVWCCFLMLVCTLECFFFSFFFHELDVVFTCFFFFQTFFLFYLLPVFSHSVFRVFTVTSVFLPFLSRGFISFLDFDCWFFFLSFFSKVFAESVACVVLCFWLLLSVFYVWFCFCSRFRLCVCFCFLRLLARCVLIVSLALRGFRKLVLSRSSMVAVRVFF